MYNHGLNRTQEEELGDDDVFASTNEWNRSCEHCAKKIKKDKQPKRKRSFRIFSSGKRRSRWYYPSHGDELELEGDKVTKTLPEENRRRRTIILYKLNNSWGFTLQSYGIHHRKENEVELLTYVDYVQAGGAAYQGGMRPGDVILSINGHNMEDVDHQNLVNFIKNAGDTMRMVVLFEDCCRKVELHIRSIKLQRLMHEKMFELRSLEHQEKRVMKGLPQFDSRRSSRSSSSCSLNSSFDDRLSLRPELDRCPTPLATSGVSPMIQRKRLALGLGSRKERSSVPAGLKLHPGLKQQNASFSDITELRKRERPVSLGVEHTQKFFPLKPQGGARSKIPVEKLLRDPNIMHTNKKHTRPKSREQPLEMEMVKLQLSDGADVFMSTSTDDLEGLADGIPDGIPDIVPLVEVSAIPKDLNSSSHSLNSSGSSAIFSMDSPLQQNLSVSIPCLHSTPISHQDYPVSPGRQPDKERLSPEGSESFYQTFIEGDIGSSTSSNLKSPLITPLKFHIPRVSRSAEHGVTSPISSDSEASRFSYSDLPGVNISFINDNDEVTEL